MTPLTEKDARKGMFPPCPICGKPADEKRRPFCSKRCADVDLNRWLSGAYVVPGADTGTDEDETPGAPARDDER